jgi:hypothetical protein
MTKLGITATILAVFARRATASDWREFFNSGVQARKQDRYQDAQRDLGTALAEAHFDERDIRRAEIEDLLATVGRSVHALGQQNIADPRSILARGSFIDGERLTEQRLAPRVVAFDSIQSPKLRQNVRTTGSFLRVAVLPRRPAEGPPARLYTGLCSVQHTQCYAA